MRDYVVRLERRSAGPVEVTVPAFHAREAIQKAHEEHYSVKDGVMVQAAEPVDQERQEEAWVLDHCYHCEEPIIAWSVYGMPETEDNYEYVITDEDGEVAEMVCLPCYYFLGGKDD